MEIQPKAKMQIFQNVNRMEVNCLWFYPEIQSIENTKENKRQAKNIQGYFYSLVEICFALRSPLFTSRLPFLFECKMSIRIGIIDGNDSIVWMYIRPAE